MSELLDLQISRDLAAESGLSSADYTVLVVLSEATDHRVRLLELCERMLWSKSRVSHQLTRMERRGLVRREAHPDNSRAVDAVLTAEGVRLIKAAAPRHVESVRRHFIDHLTGAQLDDLGDLSEAVVARLHSDG